MNDDRKEPRPVREARLYAMDFETTGKVSGYPVEPWQVGIVGIRQGRVSDDVFESYIRVGDRPFSPHAPGRHRRSRAEIAAAPTAQALWPLLFRKLSGYALVAHNVGTERSILRRMAPLHRFGPWVDSLKLVKHAYPGMGSLALSDVVAVLGLGDRVMELCPGREAHDALYDAFCSAVILEHLLEQPAWRDVMISDISG